MLKSEKVVLQRGLGPVHNTTKKYSYRGHPSRAHAVQGVAHVRLGEQVAQMGIRRQDRGAQVLRLLAARGLPQQDCAPTAAAITITIL